MKDFNENNKLFFDFCAPVFDPEMLMSLKKVRDIFKGVHIKPVNSRFPQATTDTETKAGERF